MSPRGGHGRPRGGTTHDQDPPSTDYKSSGWPEIVVEIRGPTTSRLLQLRAGAARGLLYAVLGPSHAAQYILGPFQGHD